MSLNAIASRPWISIKYKFTEFQLLQIKLDNNSRHFPKHVSFVGSNVAWTWNFVKWHGFPLTTTKLPQLEQNRRIMFRDQHNYTVLSDLDNWSENIQTFDTRDNLVYNNYTFLLTTSIKSSSKTYLLPERITKVYDKLSGELKCWQTLISWGCSPSAILTIHRNLLISSPE